MINKNNQINLSDDLYFMMIKDIIWDVFKNDVDIILFGSRARGTHNDNSDYDICVIAKNFDNSYKIAVVNDIIENSNIPFKVEIIDFSNTTGILREEILNEGIKWIN